MGGISEVKFMLKKLISYTILCARNYSRILLAIILPFLLVTPFSAHAISPIQIHASEKSVCDLDVKAEVAEALAKMSKKMTGASQEEKLASEAELYKQFEYCAEDSEKVAKDDPFVEAAKQCGAKASNIGSLYYEEMSCCGYDPQKRQFGCPVKIKQTFGYGTPAFPGSYEHVLHCVANANGQFVPVGHGSVHLADEIYGERPSWQFAVISKADLNMPLDGSTKRVRSILSWGFKPTSCDFKPIWGNALDYRIRLDQ